MDINDLSYTITLEDLEDNLGSASLPDFVDACEKNFSRQVEVIAQKVVREKQIRAVFVSGPTSSGKTTSSRIMAETIARGGRRAISLELDNYYLPKEVRYDADGRPDYESIDTLDLELMARDLKALFAYESVHIPVFDFHDRKRHYDDMHTIKLEPQDVLVVEGLHGLAPEITSAVPRAARLSYFIMPEGRLMSDNRLFSAQDVRTLRRISRDVNHRGASALDTIDYWPMIKSIEDAVISKYRNDADYFVNSLLLYEFFIIAPLAKKQIEISLDLFRKGSLPSSSYSKNTSGHSDLKRAVREAERLLAATEIVPPVKSMVVPANSILREFI